MTTLFRLSGGAGLLFTTADDKLILRVNVPFFGEPSQDVGELEREEVSEDKLNELLRCRPVGLLGGVPLIKDEIFEMKYNKKR